MLHTSAASSSSTLFHRIRWLFAAAAHRERNRRRDEDIKMVEDGREIGREIVARELSTRRDLARCSSSRFCAFFASLRRIWQTPRWSKDWTEKTTEFQSTNHTTQYFPQLSWLQYNLTRKLNLYIFINIYKFNLHIWAFYRNVSILLISIFTWGSIFSTWPDIDIVTGGFQIFIQIYWRIRQMNDKNIQ